MTDTTTPKTFPEVAWPPAGDPGAVVSTKAFRVFLIQAVWAYPEEQEKNLRWSSYYASAYRDRVSGQLFVKAYPEWTNHPERVRYGHPASEHHESWAFTTLEAAMGCMAKLREVAEWAADYEHNTDWAIPRRGRPIKFRVVEVQMAHLVTVAVA